MKITGYRSLKTIHNWGRPIGDVNGVIESGITEVPILMLTTESQAEKKDAGRKAGATGWIVKPFNGEQLLATLKKLIKETILKDGSS